MAPQSSRTDSSLVLSKGNFAESLLSISSRFSLFNVFEDFLTMSIAACTQNPQTRKSWYEDEYLNTISPYKDSELRHEFPKAFLYLVQEMEEKKDSSSGNDVLGEFFEQHISNGRKGQFFTPYHLCKCMASIVQGREKAEINDLEEADKPKRMIDPCCGSGRMLIASRNVHGALHEYYGIDIDHTCVKMTALNLFFNGVWNSEVMCANALYPGDFVIAYRISLLPLGIFKIEEKKNSKLWHLTVLSVPANKYDLPGATLFPNGILIEEQKKDNSTQLDLF
jgi:hypothetical protein